jgi:exosortase/archaeosortase family protein
MGKSRNKSEGAAAFIRRQMPIIRAALIFTASIAVFFAIVTNRYFVHWITDPSSTMNAAVSGWILRMFGVEVTTQGIFMYGVHGTLAIATGCNGVEALVIYFSAILAFPAKWKDKMTGAAIGFTGIFLINLLRILCLFIVSQYYPGENETAHIYVGQTLVIVMTLGLFLLWAEKSSRVQK